MVPYSNDRYFEALQKLQILRAFDGAPSQFWQIYLDCLNDLACASAGMICLRGEADNQGWKSIALGPSEEQQKKYGKALISTIPRAAEACLKTGSAILKGKDFYIVAVFILAEVDPSRCMSLFIISGGDEKNAVNAIRALQAATDIPAQYRIHRAARTALEQRGQLAEILDVNVLLNTQHRFLAAAMTLCNELASRYQCSRVCLGWHTRSYIRLKAMNQADSFEKKMDAVQKLEAIMEESFDQECEIVYPAPDGYDHIVRDHEVYAKMFGVAHMATIPMRHKNEVVAVCTLERTDNAFTESEMRNIRIVLDQVIARLSDLQHRDRWAGLRFADWSRRKLAELIGYEHTWTKAIGIIVSVILLFVLLVPVRYRVDSQMILKTDDITYLTAPFDGYIAAVSARAGDFTGKGKPLLSLDKKDLILEEAGLLAERNRQQREEEKARAGEKLADMCIAQAQRDQTLSRLAVVEYRLSQATLISPYDGVIIEGNQQERIGSPVKQGEVLFKIGKIKDIYAQIKVRETEIHNIHMGAKGQIALSSRPQDVFNIEVFSIEPAAVVDQGGNMFMVQCHLTSEIPQWFRPGMTGVGKINAGWKTVAWIVSHQTLDFLRLKLWW